MANKSVCKGLHRAPREEPTTAKTGLFEQRKWCGGCACAVLVAKRGFHWGAECIMYISNLKSKPFWRVTRFGLSAAGLWHIMACAELLDAMFWVIVISHMGCRQSPVQSGTGINNLDTVRVNKTASIHMFPTCCGDMWTVLDSAATHLA